MAKKIKGKVRMLLSGGAATPAPPAGSALGPHGVNIMDFCKKFNAETANRKGETVPVVVTIYVDRSFDFTIKTTPTSELIRKRLNISKGSSKPSIESAGKITSIDLEEIAKAKMPDLNAFELEQAKKVIAGTARSMGIEVVE